MDAELQERLRQLPKMDALLTDPESVLLVAEYGRPQVLDALRTALDSSRARIRSDGALASASDIISDAHVRLVNGSTPSLRPVVNATGIVLHTNLGRAPLSAEVLQAMADVGEGYSNLEYDLAQGTRGSRQVHVDSLLCRLTGAEAALVVNNNAAAVMLAVNTVARDGEVVTSRGELIEIGGSFRIPDVVESSEARLREVGTTNRTRIGDFEKAITPFTRVLLKVHPSNYRVTGFTESPSREDVAGLAREHGLVSIEDLGSGTLIDLKQFGLPPEPTVQQAVTAGIDVITFSGDKLLGGPQAGIAVGRADIVAQMKRNPLYRALRVDKSTLAALETTLRAYLNPDTLIDRLPVLRTLAQTLDTLQARATRLVKVLQRMDGVTAESVVAESFAGGGSLPQEALPDVAVRICAPGRSADALHEALRQGHPAVVGRIADDALQLHMRTIADADVPRIEAAFARLRS